LRHYFWNDPHLYKEGVDGIMRRCVSEYKQQEILRKCHGSAYGGHHAEIEPHKRFYNQVFIGQPSLKMLEGIFYLAMNVKELVIFLDEMKCL
jgi:hypothetical protein